MYQIVRRLILDLGEPYTPPARTATGEAQVLCLPATGEGDELAALMLAQLLERRGVPVEVMSARSLSSEMAELAEKRSAPIICVSSVPGTSIVAALHLCKRLRLRLPEKTIYIGIWLRRQVTADPARCVVESLSCDRDALPAYVPVSGDSELPVHAFAMHWNRVDAGI